MSDSQQKSLPDLLLPPERSLEVTYGQLAKPPQALPEWGILRLCRQLLGLTQALFDLGIEFRLGIKPR